MNFGQTCHAGTRIYVHEDVYERFIEAFTERMKKMRVGDNFDENSDQGPQNSKMQFDKILGEHYHPLQYPQHHMLTLHFHRLHRLGQRRRSNPPPRWQSTRSRTRPRKRLLHRTHHLHRRETTYENHAGRDLRSRRLHCQI